MGRSVRGTAAVGEVMEGRVAAEEDSVDTGADATVLEAAVGARTGSLTAALVVVVVVAAAPGAVGFGTALTGRGCDIGVS